MPVRSPFFGFHPINLQYGRSGCSSPGLSARVLCSLVVLPGCRVCFCLPSAPRGCGGWGVDTQVLPAPSQPTDSRLPLGRPSGRHRLRSEVKKSELENSTCPGCLCGKHSFFVVLSSLTRRKLLRGLYLACCCHVLPPASEVSTNEIEKASASCYSSHSRPPYFPILPSVRKNRLEN